MMKNSRTIGSFKRGKKFEIRKMDLKIDEISCSKMNKENFNLLPKNE